jgi:hypothetical protein
MIAGRTLNMASDDIANRAVANTDYVGVTESTDVSKELSARFAQEMAGTASKPRANVVQLKTLEAIGATASALSERQASPERVAGDVQVGQATLQRWYGEVLDIDDEYFHARLEPASMIGGASEIADFPLTMISADDKQLLRVGASFSYAVFSETQRSGRRTVSALVFRRSGVPIEARVRSAEEKAERWIKYFDSNTECPQQRAE